MLNATKYISFTGLGGFAFGFLCYAVWGAIEFFAPHGFTSYLSIGFFTGITCMILAMFARIFNEMDENAYMQNDKTSSFRWKKASLWSLLASLAFLLVSFYDFSWLVLKYTISNTAVLDFPEVVMLSSFALVLLSVPSYFFLKLADYIRGIYTSQKTIPAA